MRPEASLVESRGKMFLRAPWGALGLGTPTPCFAAVLKTLAGPGGTADELAAEALHAGGEGELAHLYYALNRFRQQAFLSFSLADAAGTLVTVIPVRRGFVPSMPPVDLEARFRLAPFSYLRQEGDLLMLASPAAPARVLLGRGVSAALLGSLLEAQPMRDVSILDRSPETSRAIIGLLADARLIEVWRPDGGPAEMEPALRQWEFHDLLLHQHSRTLHHGEPFGGVFPFAGSVPPLPAVKPESPGERIALARPSREYPAARSLTLDELLERRTSQRAFGETPITAQQLGEFLYRCARVGNVKHVDPAANQSYETTSRPYPSGGATYELEVYPAVQQCRDLQPDLYHYEPLSHTLAPLSAEPALVSALFRDAGRAAPLETPPQVLIVLAARFQRVSWKYRSMAYALTLKHVGVLYQTMYFVAAAMGLAACALGAGDAELFSAAARTDFLTESSVGEFLLGSAPA